MVSSNSMQPGHEVGAAVDGNKTTYFQTKSNGNTSDPRPYIDITLNEGINGTFYLGFDEYKVSSNDRNPKRANIYASSDVITAATPVSTQTNYRSVNAVSEHSLTQRPMVLLSPISASNLHSVRTVRISIMVVAHLTGISLSFTSTFITMRLGRRNS